MPARPPHHGPAGVPCRDSAGLTQATGRVASRGERTLRRAAACVLAVLAATGCGQAVPGRARPAAAGDAAPTAATAPLGASPASRDSTDLAVAALQRHWRAAFPAAFGRPWTDIATFAPVASRDPAAPAPPCGRSAADLSGQAYYCPAADAVVWDADGLVPGLRERHGPAGVVVVLAHEVGHAVQTRLGVDAEQRRDPAGHPTILLEAMADCYAGVTIAHLATGAEPDFVPGPAERDAALLALVGFRDPLGVQAGDASAHGNAFDRVSSFLDGYAGGATRCAAMTLQERAFTQRRFGSAADRARGGNLSQSRLLAAVEADARDWFSTVAAGRAPGWRAPPLSRASACAGRVMAAQGPVRYCPVDAAVDLDEEQLATVHRRFGDYADATLVAGRYGLATLGAVGAPVEGPAAAAAATCLAGAYTGRLIDPSGGFSLSPGDLDEAVQLLLGEDWAARDAGGTADPAQHGLERLAHFRDGLHGGPARCLPA